MILCSPALRRRRRRRWSHSTGYNCCPEAFEKTQTVNFLAIDTRSLSWHLISRIFPLPFSISSSTHDGYSIEFVILTLY